MAKRKWYEKSYRRNLVDMHIDDWDEKFMSEFEPIKYVELMKTAGVQSAMVYANSHVGCCYWPTKTGHMHLGLKGRDIFGDIGRLCHKEGIDFIAYYSLVYNNWAYDYNTSWKIIDVDGKGSRDKKFNSLISGRYGVCCPNTGYRDFSVAQIEELCQNYEFEGIFFDMLFWPGICYCPACRKRFLDETGENVPEIIDWNDPLWLKFQQKREEWMTEFAELATQTVKRIKPDATVLHNSNPPILFPAYFGSSSLILEACDYLGGDFYATNLHTSYVCKMFYNTSKNLPFEYYTSRCDPNLHDDHVSMKHTDQLKLDNYISLAHNGAFLFIDAVDPDGTLNPETYKIMGEVFKESEAYEPYIGGEMVSDVAVYYSLNSKMDPKDSGKSARELSMKMPHMDAALGASRVLKENHIPFTVISENNLEDLSKYQILVLPDVTMLKEEEAEAVRRFVKEGGSLYASGRTSPILLSDVFGIELIGETKENVTFMAPTVSGKSLMQGISERYPLTINGSQLLVKAREPENVIARVVLPYTDPANLGRFASIHSDPPGKVTDYPSIIYRSYGKGKVIWSAAPFEAVKRIPHAGVFANIIKELAKESFAFEVDAPAPVEVTMFSSENGERCIINVINEQDQMPPVKVHDIRIRIRLKDNMGVQRVIKLPGGEKLDYEIKGAYVEFALPALDIFEMIAADFKYTE